MAEMDVGDFVCEHESHLVAPISTKLHEQLRQYNRLVRQGASIEYRHSQHLADDRPLDLTASSRRFRTGWTAADQSEYSGDSLSNALSSRDSAVNGSSSNR